ncbi:MAG: SDR family NAD(P)-dependent oxidoreductase, partial [Specibacter sp.]
MPHAGTPAPLHPARRFPGKVAVITGASRGIGLATAHRFAAEGASVLITARRREQLDEALASLGGNAVAMAGHAEDPDHRAEVLAAVEHHFGGLDVLVNNAGINPVFGPLETAGLDAARKIFEVNVLGTLAWTQAVLAHPGLGFRARRGNVVNVSS